MTTNYGPAQRLDEQIEILLRDARATEIVVLSLLGDAAVPRLCWYLDANTRGEPTPVKLDGDATNAIIRVLGMSAHPNIVPTLARRLARESKNAWHSRDEAEPRAIVNALRKVGDDAALSVILDNLPRLDLFHARSVMDHFGTRAREAVLLRVAKLDRPEWLEAAQFAASMRIKEAVPLLTHATEKRPEAIELLAFYGKDAPKQWAVERLLKMQTKIVHAYLKSRPVTDVYGRRSSEKGPDREHDALLRLLFHAGDPSVLPALAPYLAIEHSVGITQMTEEPPPSVTLLALAFGQAGADQLSDDKLPADLPDTFAAARIIRSRIQDYAKKAADYAEAKAREFYRRDERLQLTGFRLPKTPMGDPGNEVLREEPPRPRAEELDYGADE